MKLSEKMASWCFASLAAVSVLIAALFLSGNAKQSNVNVKHNFKTLDEFAEIDREAWKRLPVQFRMPVYETFSKEKKKVFWQLKHEELKKLDWTPAELEHIASFYSVICENPMLMQRGAESEELEDWFEIFKYNWREHSLDILGWDRQLLYAITISADEVLNTRGELKAYTPIDVNIRLRSITRGMSYNRCPECPKIGDGNFGTIYLPHPQYCAAFYTCSNGIAIAQWCPDGLAFNSLTEACDWPHNVLTCWD